MKKRYLWLFALVLVCSLALVGCGGDKTPAGGGDAQGDGQAASGDDTVYEVKISHIVPETDACHTGYLWLKEQMETKSNGRLKVTIYPNRQLSNSNAEDAEKVMQNIVQIAMAPTSVLAGTGNVTGFQIFDMPYLFGSTEELYYALDSGLMEELSSQLSAKSNMQVMGVSNGGWCPIGANKVYNTVADMKGQKIRILTSDAYMALMTAFGAVGTPIAYGETYTAMQQGTVDGTITNFPGFYIERYYEVISELNMLNPFAILHGVMVSDQFYQSLPADLQEIFYECMYDFEDYMRELRAQEEIDYTAALEDGLMNLKWYTEEELAPFKEATSGVIDDFASQIGQDIIDRAYELKDEFAAQAK